jgi:hypothetical protein
MPIDLIDIPAAVADYLDNQVRTVVSPVIGKQSSQASLTPGQDGTLTVTVTNRGMPDGGAADQCRVSREDKRRSNGAADRPRRRGGRMLRHPRCHYSA